MFSREDFERKKKLFPLRVEYDRETKIINFYFKPSVMPEEMEHFLSAYEIARKIGETTTYTSPIYYNLEIDNKTRTAKINASTLQLENYEDFFMTIQDGTSFRREEIHISVPAAA